MQRPKISAGLLIYRKKNKKIEVLLAHPGGPFWMNKNKGVWSIPKGEPEENEDLLSAAIREAKEEIDLKTIKGEFVPLGSVIQKNGKIVYAWAIEGNYDLKMMKSNTFKTEWPPRSGKITEFPEIDRAEFFEIKEAQEKINPSQIKFLERLRKINKI
ncbi:MAG: NUDIX domain-containing protein [Patescibacteria group bacterium]